MKKEKVTMKDMCDAIEKSGILADKKGKSPTSKEIFNYSATGELWRIFEWYETAKILLDK